MSRAPRGAISISFGDGRFYFHAGVFYQWRLGKCVVVNAPIGILVPVLPRGCIVEVVGGETYYVLHGAYYRRTHGGYIVVRRPTRKAIVVENPATTRVATRAVTVWVQNPNGSRTPVKLKPTEDGQWTGPKGEYYHEFPAESQLKPIYGLPGKPAPDAVAAPARKTATLWIVNMNGSKTLVELEQTEGGTWRGPNGEVYEKLPTELQLKAAYGLTGEAKADDTAQSDEKIHAVSITRTTGAKGQVLLRQLEDGSWRGPRGEVYDKLPTQAQLEAAYGRPDGPASEPEPDPTGKTQTVWITNENGSKTPVALAQVEDGVWRGPKGETYKTLPTEAELRAAYGLQKE